MGKKAATAGNKFRTSLSMPVSLNPTLSTGHVDRVSSYPERRAGQGREGINADVVACCAGSCCLA